MRDAVLSTTSSIMTKYIRERDPTKWAIKVAGGSIVRGAVLRNRGIRKDGWRADSLCVYLFVLR